MKWVLSIVGVIISIVFMIICIGIIVLSIIKDFIWSLIEYEKKENFKDDKRRKKRKRTKDN